MAGLVFLCPQSLRAAPSFQDAFDQHSSNMLLIDPSTGEIVDANPAASAFYGWSREEMRTMKIQDINTFTPEQVKKELEAAKKEHRSHFIFRHRLADGTIKTMEIHSVPMDFNGRTLLYSVTRDISHHRDLEKLLWSYQHNLEQMVDQQTQEIRDHTQWRIWTLSISAVMLCVMVIYLLFMNRERRRAAEALIKSEERYREMCENMNSCVAIYRAWNDGEDFIFTEFNRAASKIDQINPEQVIGKRLTEVFPAVRKFGLLGAFQNVWETGEPEHFPITFYNDGRISGWRDNHIYKLPSGEIVAIYDDVTDLKKAEQDIEHQRALLEGVFNDIPDALVLTDIDRKIIKINKGFTRIFGYQEDEVRGQSTSLYYKSPEEFERQRHLRYNRRVKISSEPYLVYYRRKNGETFPGETTGTAIKDQSGDIIAFIGDIRDIAERQKNESEIRKLSQAVKQSNSSIIISDIDGRIEYVNPCFEQTTGYTSEEAIGQNPRFLQSGETPLKQYKALWRTISSGKDWRGEFHNRRKDGSLYWEAASISPIKDNDGNITNYLAIKEDITEHKNAELALQEREERYRAVITTSQDGFIAHDKVGRIVDVNDAYLKRSGFKRQEILKKNISNLQFHKNQRDVEANFKRIMKAGSIQFTTRHRTKSGEMWSVEASVSYSDIEGGRFFGFTRDITDKAQIQNQLIEAKRHEAQARLTSGVAHEFNNALNIIGGFVRLAEDEVNNISGDGMEQMRIFLGMAIGGVNDAGKVTKELLSLSRNSEISLENVMAKSLVSNSLELIESYIRDEIKLNQDIRNGDELISIDDRLFRQVVINLAGNASDAMSGKGKLTLGCYRVEGDKSILSLDGSIYRGPLMALYVADDGPGIAKNIQDRIFEPFYSTKPEDKGTGLGLFIVAGIVQRMGGVIEIDSTPGHGATFTTYLPIQN
jgi:PAS domain S-box-containing protein